jgi:uncharacterized protein YlxW (UPF0749 family)
MANIFGILTSLVLIATVFVAFKNKNLYQTEIDNVIEEKRRLDISKERYSTALKNLEALNTEIPVVQARTAELVASAEKQTSDNEAGQKEIETKNGEISRNRNRISELQERLSSFGDPDQLIANLTSLLAELEALNSQETGVPGLQARLENLTATATRVEAENVQTQSVLEGYSRGESKPGMNTRIRSIYPSWGFVTLASGGISGVAGNSTMDVVRGNQVIAKLQVTAVEPNSASATIVPGSLADDVTLSVGDLVVPGAKIADK